MSDITVYEKPTCTTCRKLVALLKEQGIDFDSVNYSVLGLEVDEVRDLLAKASLTPREVLRTREPEYKELGLADPSVTDDAMIAAIVAHPALLQRPIVVRGDRAVLARPIERVNELFA
jgi:arsenate reductase